MTAPSGGDAALAPGYYRAGFQPATPPAERHCLSIEGSLHDGTTLNEIDGKHERVSLAGLHAFAFRRLDL